MNIIKRLFTKKKRQQGPVSISPMANAKSTTTQEVDQAINALRDDLLAVKPAPGPCTPNPGATEEERKRREEQIRRKQKRSTVEKKMSDINLEKEYFPKSFDLPSWKIAEHHWKQGRTMTLPNYLALFSAVMDNNIRTVDDLTRIDSKTRDTILSRVISKPGFLKLIKTCQEIQRDAPTNSGIVRNQFIMDRLSKVFNP